MDALCLSLLHRNIAATFLSLFIVVGCVVASDMEHFSWCKSAGHVKLVQLAGGA